MSSPVLSRRHVLALSAGGAAASVLAPRLLAMPAGPLLRLTVPARARRGDRVTIAAETFDAREVQLFSELDPSRPIATARFSAAQTEGTVVARLRVVRSQAIVAVARMENGAISTSVAQIIVIGGAGASPA